MQHHFPAKGASVGSVIPHHLTHKARKEKKRKQKNQGSYLLTHLIGRQTTIPQMAGGHNLKAAQFVAWIRFVMAGPRRGRKNSRGTTL
jgi:hypothetical protein